VVIKKQRRKIVFERDNCRCLKCGTADRLTVDHIVPKYLGGGNQLVNLQTLCFACNVEKGATIACYADRRKSKSYAIKFKDRLWKKEKTNKKHGEKHELQNDS